MMDLFLTNTQLFALQDINWWTVAVWVTCRLLWCFYQQFELSLWRHPFTVEDPLVSKWCNAKFLQICSDEDLICLNCTRWNRIKIQTMIFAVGLLKKNIDTMSIMMSSTRSTKLDCHYKDAPFQGPAWVSLLGRDESCMTTTQYTNTTHYTELTLPQLTVARQFWLLWEEERESLRSSGYHLTKLDIPWGLCQQGASYFQKEKS